MLSNGYDITRVLAAMRGRLGWHQPTRPGVPTLTTPNITATSGRYYGEAFHESATLFRFFETQETPNISAADFNTLLSRVDDEITMRCINAIFNRPQLVDSGLAYNRAFLYNRQIPVVNTNKFCGYRIKIAPGDYALQVQTAALLFDGAATFNLHLFNDLKATALATKSVTTVANDQQIVSLDWVANYLSDTNKGGIFYVGYFQEDLGAVKALSEQYQSPTNTKAYGIWPVQLTAIGNTDFDRVNPSIQFYSYGLNLQIATYRDYTETICRNAHLFDEVRGLTMAIRCLGTQLTSMRLNQAERNGKDISAITVDMNLAFPTENMPYVAGLKSQVIREFKRINENFYPKDLPFSADISGGDREPMGNYQGFNLADVPGREYVA